MTKILIFLQLIFLSFFVSCKSDKVISHETEYLRWVGDIEYNSSSDNANFKICNGEDQIKQYFNAGKGPQYSGEKPTLVNAFKSKYQPELDKSQNGLIRIRFIVNCEGQAGRFRVLQAGDDFKETEFDEKIVTQLVQITKDIDEWVILHRSDKPIDYYYYLIFRIKNGEISEILP